MHSKKVLATDKKSPRLNWWEYWIEHCWMTGWQSIGESFDIWKDLLTGNWSDYALLDEDDPYEQCYLDFWYSLGGDETLPKSLLEDLMRIVDEIERGEHELIPFTQDMFDQLHELIDPIDEDSP